MDLGSGKSMPDNKYKPISPSSGFRDKIPGLRASISRSRATRYLLMPRQLHKSLAVAPLPSLPIAAIAGFQATVDDRIYLARHRKKS